MIQIKKFRNGKLFDEFSARDGFNINVDYILQEKMKVENSRYLIDENHFLVC